AMTAAIDAMWMGCWRTSATLIGPASITAVLSAKVMLSIPRTARPIAISRMPPIKSGRIAVTPCPFADFPATRTRGAARGSTWATVLYVQGELRGRTPCLRRERLFEGYGPLGNFAPRRPPGRPADNRLQRFTIIDR